MDNFIVSARKYRPRNFDTVVGQQAIANTLKRAIVTHKLAGAYLFCGPRGVGKTTCARIFAKAINCLNPQGDGEACDECDSCKSFNEGRSVNVQELNAAANNSVDDIRNIIDQVRIPPQLGKYKVVILDEVHMLSTAASNALLKTLEEPPAYVIFILATTEKQKIIPTILSRCQIFDFNRMNVGDIVGQLKMVAEKEGMEYEEQALNVIAQKADGGMRDSLSIFDQVASFSGGNITLDCVLRCMNVLDYDYYFKITDFLLGHEVTQAMLLFNEIVTKGFNGGVFISGLASHFRDLLMSRAPETVPLIDAADDVRQRYAEQAQKCTPPFLYRAIRLCDRCGNEYKTSYNKRLSVEITLIQVSQIGTAEDDPGCGLGPSKKLKPLFKSTAKSATAAPKAPAQKPSAQKAAAPQGFTAGPNGGASGPQSSAVGNSATAAPKQPVKPAETLNPLKIKTPAEARAFLRRMGSVPIYFGDDEEKPGSTAAEGSANYPQGGTAAANGQQTAANGATTAANGQQGAAEAPETDSEPLGEEPYNETNLLYYWREFANALTYADGALKGRMLSVTSLGINPDDTIILMVASKEVGLFFQPQLPRIQNFLRKKTNNRNITLQTQIMPEQAQAIAYDPRELYKKMLNESPDLYDLQKAFNFRLN